MFDWNPNGTPEFFNVRDCDYVGNVAGVDFYEHPLAGDEDTLLWLGPISRKLHASPWYELPSYQECMDWLNGSEEYGLGA